MTVDREQIRLALEQIVARPWNEWTEKAKVIAPDCLALLAELEQAERERDEQATLAETRKVSRREYRERAEAAERREAALAEALNEFRRMTLKGEKWPEAWLGSCFCSESPMYFPSGSPPISVGHQSRCLIAREALAAYEASKS